MNMLIRIIAILIIAILLTYPCVINADILHEIDRISYTLIYDPEDNLGMAILKVYVNQINEYEEISLPINIFASENAIYDFLYYTSSVGLEVLPSYDNNTNILSFMVKGNGSAEFVFSVKDLMEEVGIGVYVLFIDSSSYGDMIPSTSFSLEIHVLGRYNIYIGEMTKNISYRSTRNSTTSSVFINGIGTLIAVFSLEIPLEDTTTMPSSPTTFTIPATPSPTPGTTVITTTSPQYHTQQTTTQPPSVFTTSSFTIALIAIGVAALITIAIFLARRSKYVPEIETGDITTDPVARSIIKILGDSGQAELLQSEIVNKTGLPKSSVSRRVRRLEEEGYIVVKRSGKYNYISLTDKGRGLYKKITGDKKS